MNFIGICILFLICGLTQIRVFGDVASSEDQTKTNTGSASAASSEEDLLDDEATVEGEDKPAAEPPTPTSLVSETEQEFEGANAGPDSHMSASPHAETVLMFTSPPLGRRSVGSGISLPVGRPTNVLIGFTNTAGSDSGTENPTTTPPEFTLDAVDATFRYPMDYSYYMQNFTAVRLSRLVEPKRQASIQYSFVPAPQLAGRPFGLTVKVTYHDQEGKQFVQAVFNDTVQVVELDEGFDTEAFFLYVFVGGLTVLGLAGLYHFMSTYGRRRLATFGGAKGGSASGGKSGAGPVEMGTRSNADVDYDWIPKEHMELHNRQSPNLSPQRRRSKRQAASNHKED